MRRDLRPSNEDRSECDGSQDLDLDGPTERIARFRKERSRKPLLLTKSGTLDSALPACCDKYRLSQANNIFLAQNENKVLLSSFEVPKRLMTQSFDTPTFQQMSRTLEFRVRLSTSAFSRSGASGMADSCFDWTART